MTVKSVLKKPRSKAQKAATRKLIAANKARRRQSSPATKRRANPHAPPFAVDYFIQVVTADDRVGFLTGDGFYNTDPNSAELFKTEAAADKAWQAQMKKVPPGTQLCIYMRKREPPIKK